MLEKILRSIWLRIPAIAVTCYAAIPVYEMTGNKHLALLFPFAALMWAFAEVLYREN